jgi:hypothetical protein
MVTDDSTPFHPTNLMEKISRYVETNPGATAGVIKRAVRGKDEWKVQALDLLVAEGYVAREAGPNRSQIHTSATLYRETSASDTPVVPGRSQVVPGRSRNESSDIPASRSRDVPTPVGGNDPERLAVAGTPEPPPEPSVIPDQGVCTGCGEPPHPRRACFAIEAVL